MGHRPPWRRSAADDSRGCHPRHGAADPYDRGGGGDGDHPLPHKLPSDGMTRSGHRRPSASPSSIGGAAPDASLDMSNGREGEEPATAFLGRALGLCGRRPLATARREGGGGVRRLGLAPPVSPWRESDAGAFFVSSFGPFYIS
jgi:hypothetical protein